MKIYFDNVNFSSNSGPNTFAHRLAVKFTELGHVIADSNDYDVALVFIEPTRALDSKKPTVQRIDGIWFAPDEFERKNRKIRELYRVADHVIFQSSFDRKMVEKWWGFAKAQSVIRNGINIANANVPSGLQRLRRIYDRVLVCSANWHPQKRLRSNIELFKHVRQTCHGKTCLIILGNEPDIKIADPDIFYAGSLPHEICLGIYRFADWFVHLAWLDHCPNVVIEALSQSLPVICSSEGGTAELISEQSGIIIQDRDQYDFSLTRYDNPPTVDVEQIGVLPEKFEFVPPDSISIDNIAHKYITVLERFARATNESVDSQGQ